MRVKVTHKFKDRHTGDIHYKGDVLEISMERYEEIKDAGDFVFPIDEDEGVQDETHTQRSLFLLKEHGEAASGLRPPLFLQRRFRLWSR